MEVQWKAHDQRFDIIRNVEFEDPGRVKKACAFDYYNENSYKGRVTKNVSEIPKTGVRVDPITGRKLKF